MVRATIAHVQPDIHVALLQDSDSTLSQKAYLVTFSAQAKFLRAIQLTGDSFFSEDTSLSFSCDQIVHCFVPATVGAHSGYLNVISVSSEGALIVIADSVFSAADPTIRGVDLNGDGINEIIAAIASCDPNCATGRRYWRVLGWDGSQYTLEGCRLVEGEEDLPSGPVDPADCP